MDSTTTWWNCNTPRSGQRTTPKQTQIGKHAGKKEKKMSEKMIQIEIRETGKAVEVTPEYLLEHLFTKLLPKAVYPISEQVGEKLFLNYFVSLPEHGFPEVPLVESELSEVLPGITKKWGKDLLRLLTMDNMRKRKTKLYALDRIIGGLTTLPAVWDTSDPIGMGVFAFMANDFDAPALLLDPVTESKIHGLPPFREGYYVIPSSIHEVLLVSKQAGLDLKALLQINREINANEVKEEDLLGEHIYAVRHGHAALDVVV